MTGRAEVADQARAVAAAWSPPGAPESWWLTAETFAAIAEDDVLLDLAVEVPADRLPPLLLSAAITLLVTEQRPEPLVGYYPRPGGPQPPRDDGFRPALRAFALAEGDALRRLCGRHRYQMNEVGRCADVLPALALVSEADPRPLALVDLGTGAGLGLHLDRYRYTYKLPGGDRLVAGDVTSGDPELRGAGRSAARLPRRAVDRVADRRRQRAARPGRPGDRSLAGGVRAAGGRCGHPVRRRGGGGPRPPDPDGPRRPGRRAPAVVAEVPRDELLCLVDTYVHVFLPPPELARFVALVHEIGRERDLDWISVDPLVPLGPQATDTVQGLPVPRALIDDNRDGGVFGLIGRLSIRDGRATGTLLGRAHPGSAWLDWTVPAQADR